MSHPGSSFCFYGWLFHIHAVVSVFMAGYVTSRQQFLFLWLVMSHPGSSFYFYGWLGHIQAVVSVFMAGYVTSMQ